MVYSFLFYIVMNDGAAVIITSEMSSSMRGRQSLVSASLTLALALLILELSISSRSCSSLSARLAPLDACS